MGEEREPDIQTFPLRITWVLRYKEKVSLILACEYQWKDVTSLSRRGNGISEAAEEKRKMTFTKRPPHASCRALSWPWHWRYSFLLQRGIKSTLQEQKLTEVNDEFKLNRLKFRKSGVRDADTTGHLGLSCNSGGDFSPDPHPPLKTTHPPLLSAQRPQRSVCSGQEPSPCFQH